MNDQTPTETWVVDSVADGLAVLIEDEDEIVVEVASELLGDLAVEGAVLTVPLGAVGEPEWSRATRDVEAEEERLEAGRQAVDELKKRDPGGDVIL
jgi:hypothetical protein